MPRLDAYPELEGTLGIKEVPLFLALYSLHASFSVSGCDPCLTLTQVLQSRTSQNINNRLHKEPLTSHSWNLPPTTLPESPELLFRQRQQRVNQTTYLCATCNFVGCKIYS